MFPNILNNYAKKKTDIPKKKYRHISLLFLLSKLYAKLLVKAFKPLVSISDLQSDLKIPTQQ